MRPLAAVTQDVFDIHKDTAPEATSKFTFQTRTSVKVRSTRLSLYDKSTPINQALDRSLHGIIHREGIRSRIKDAFAITDI